MINSNEYIKYKYKFCKLKSGHLKKATNAEKLKFLLANYKNIKFLKQKNKNYKRFLQIFALCHFFENKTYN